MGEEIRTILLIEDDPIDTKYETKLLKDGIENINIAVVSSKKEFDAAIEDLYFDVIVADYNLGFMNGLDVVKDVRKKLITPIIIISGAIGEEKTAMLMEAGASELIIKDDLADKLVPIVNRELDNFTYKMEQIKVQKMVNNLLLAISRTLDWVIKHDIQEVSFLKILTNFGNILNIGRSYIYQKIGKEYTQRYKWVNKNIEYDNHYISDDTLYFLFKRIELGKSVTSTPMNDDDNFKTLIWVPIFNQDSSMWGFLGFDEIIGSRTWTSIELNALEVISGILGTIIYKMETTKKEKEEINRMLSGLDKFRDDFEDLKRQVSSKHG